jgi:hypothetical protein
MSPEDDYAKQYWNLGNVVCGFAVAQALIGIYNFATSNVFACNMVAHPLIVSLGTTVFHSFYGLVVLWCYRAERCLRVGDKKPPAIPEAEAPALPQARFLNFLPRH